MLESTLVSSVRITVPSAAGSGGNRIGATLKVDGTTKDTVSCQIAWGTLFNDSGVGGAGYGSSEPSKFNVLVLQVMVPRKLQLKIS